MKRFLLILSVCTAALLAAGLATAADYVFFVPDHWYDNFDRYVRNTDGTITFDARYTMQCVDDPAGIAAWYEYDANGFVTKAYLFMTGEWSYCVEVIDAMSFTYVGAATPPNASELAGIAMDNVNNILYAVQRSGTYLYAFDWNPSSLTLTPRAGYPVPLNNITSALGLALDSRRGIIYVADAGSGYVKGYSVGTLTEVFSWIPSSAPADIEIDQNRNILYTTHPNGYCAWGQPGGADYVCAYDLDNGTEYLNPGPMLQGTMGIAVHEESGFIYVTHGCDGDSVSVWDPSTKPFTHKQTLAYVGNPAGIAAFSSVGPVPCVPSAQIVTDISPTVCVVRGNTVTISTLAQYECLTTCVCLPIGNVVEQLWLAPHMDFVSATGGGAYDPGTHSVIWSFGTMSSGQIHLNQIVARVSPAAEPDEVLGLRSEVRSDLDSTKWDHTTQTVIVCHVPDPPCPPPTLSLVGYRTVSYAPPLWEVQVEVRSDGGNASNVSVTMNEEIAWLTIPDPNCDYGAVPAGGSSWGNDTYTFDLTNSPGGSFNVWFDVTYADACGNQFRVRLDPEFSPEKVAAGQTPAPAFRLTQNYPNPFNPNTTISYEIPVGSYVNLQVFDVSGRLVKTLFDGFKGEGLHSVNWNGADNLGKMVASGIYLYRIEAGNFVETKRMVLLR